MRLKLERKYLKETYTIGNLYIDGKFFCNTIEDKVRDLNKDGDLLDPGETKVYGETAIPYGTYEITLDVVSPKFSKYPFYMEICNGKLPRLLNVPHFEGILIHVADGYRGADLVQGCIGIGKNKIKGGLLEGKETFKKLYNLLDTANKNREAISIEIV